MQQAGSAKKRALEVGVKFLHKQSFILLLLLGCCLIPLPAPARADTIDDFIRVEMVRQKIPGLSMAVVRSGKTVRAQGYGKANSKLSVPATADTVYPLGFVGNEFTAAAVLLLMEEGRISVDNPLGMYLDFAPASWKALTVHHLLTHTSGVKDYATLIEPSGNSVDTRTARNLAETPLDFAPGEKSAYSQSNYLLLRMIIEKASGMKYGDYLKKRIFAPLGLQSARVSRGEAYSISHNAALDSSLVMSVRDMGKWAAALDTNLPLTRNLRQKMWTPVSFADGKTYPYSLSGAIGRQNDHAVIRHTSATADVSRYPDDKLSVIVLTNTAGVDTARISREIAGRIAPTLKVVEQHERDATALVQTVIRQITEARLDKNLFAPEMWEVVKEYATPQRAKQIKQLGALKKTTLMVHQNTGQERVYQYRLQFARVGLRCVLTLDVERKIAGLLLSAGG